jgi:proteasome lid subunit RPN8/RPN11
MALAAQAAWPRECCGVALGPRREPDLITRFVSITNVSARPERAFELDPLEHLKLLRTADDDGLEQRAIVHSHPGGGPAPSRLDADHAALWPGVPWIIVPVEAGGAGRAVAGAAVAWSFVGDAPQRVAVK